MTFPMIQMPFHMTLNSNDRTEQLKTKDTKIRKTKIQENESLLSQNNK